MQASPMLLPKPVGDLFSRLPAYPGSLLFVTALNLALAKQLGNEVGDMLQGKSLRLCVTDARVAFDFAWINGRFVARQPSRTGAVPDLTISASAHDFVLLAQRKEDPDTLFFSRRLAMEGDTELGLMVKNTIDAIELPVFDPQQFAPTKLLDRLRARAQRSGGAHPKPGFKPTRP
ncbi:MAG TPA: SCP2 sterol-binding domain-containing protein [Burkholderiaceae bacterium]|nr:SCP2 sterol-binding domain-containing protein [Burkholderiaceae bacterium]